MSDLDKAREWAERMDKIEGLMPGHRAAAEVIQSLPNAWVDVEKVREIIEEMKNLPATTGVASEIAIATEAWKRRLEVLVPPKLPTLADMTQEEREACKWMQAKTWYEVGIIVWVDEDAEIAEIITQNNGTLERKFKDVTPLTGEPKLEWPGNKLAETPALPEDERIEAWHEIAGHKFFDDCYRDGVLLDHMIKKLDEVELRKYPLPSFVRPAYHGTYGYGFAQRWTNPDGEKPSFFFSSEPGGSHEMMVEEKVEDNEITYLDQAQIKLSTQQDYREAPVGTVVKHRAEGADVFIKTRDLMWRNLDSGVSFSSFKMSGDIREIVTVIEVK